MNNEVCTKCGAELNNTDRACLRCGTLNPNNPLNNDVLKNLKKPKVKKEQNDNLENNFRYNVMSLNTSSRFSIPSLVSFILVNGMIFFFLLFELFTNYKGVDNFSTIIILSIVYFYFICIQLIDKKAGYPWFSIFIPLYNIYVTYKIVFNNWLLPIVLNILPGILILFFGKYLLLNNIGIYTVLLYANKIIPGIISLIYTFKLGRRFGRSGILTILFGFIIIPAIAISPRYEYY